MKTCTKCKIEKQLADFNKNVRRADGLQSICRPCSKEKYKEYYSGSEVEKLRLRENKKKHNKKVLDYVRKAKEVPCADCKIQYPHYVMDFDHLRDKSFNISEGHLRYGLARIIEEIQKCEIVCSNCHRIRTYGKEAKGERSRFISTGS